MKLRTRILLGLLPTLALAVILMNQSLLVGKGKPPKDPPPEPEPPAILYELVFLGDLGAPGSSWAFDINELGEVVGQSDTADGKRHAYIYTSRFSGDGTVSMVDLNDQIDPASGWTLEVGEGINNLGEVVGFGDLNGEMRAFRFSPPGVDEFGNAFPTEITMLPVPENTSSSFAFDINDHGDVSGLLAEVDGEIIVVLWDADDNDQMMPLGLPWGGGFPAINDSKEVAATLGISPDEDRGFRFDPDGTVNNIGLLDAATEQCVESSRANDLNNAGTIVGSSSTTIFSTRGKKQKVTCGPVHAIRYSDTNGLEDIGTLGGAVSFARGINENGDIVGKSEIDPRSLRVDVFLYTDDDLDGDGQPEGMVNVTESITNLPTELLEINDPLNVYKINCSLEICGRSYYGGAFILRPIQP